MTAILFIPAALLRSSRCVIDNTGNMVAAGEIIDSKEALQIAARVNKIKNVLKGVAAILRALWATFNVEQYCQFKDSEKRKEINRV